MPPTQSIDRNARLSARIAMAALTALVAFAGLIALLSFRPALVTAAPISGYGTEVVNPHLPDPSPHVTAFMLETGTRSDEVDLPSGAATGVLAPTAPPTDTTTTITLDTPDPSVVGQSVTVNFSVTPDAASSDNIVGTVMVVDGTGASCSTGVSGSILIATGSCALTPTTAGVKTLTATFTPSDPGLFNGSFDTELHNVDKHGTSTTIARNPSTPVFGQTVTFTATVASTAGTPSGAVFFDDEGVNIGSGVLNASGVVTITYDSLGARLHKITAVYTGDDDFAPGQSNPLH